MTFTAESIAINLPKGRRVGTDKYTCCCPSHDDRNPSLSITQKGDTVLVYCHSGCSQSEVISALRDKGLWPQVKQRTRSPHYLSEGDRLYLKCFVMTYESDLKRGIKPAIEDSKKYSLFRQKLARAGCAA